MATRPACSRAARASRLTRRAASSDPAGAPCRAPSSDAMDNDLFSTLQHPTVRDLAWAIGAPGLIDPSHPTYRDRVVEDSWCLEQLQAASGWLRALDLAPQPLLDFLASRPTRRIGHYFES